MPDMQHERRHLAQTDRHLAEGRRRVAEQIARIERMTGRGQDTREAEKLLRNLEKTLEQFRIHRGLILDAIARG